MHLDIFLYIFNKENIIIIIKLYFTNLDKDDDNKINLDISKIIIILSPEYTKFEDIFN